MKSVYASGKLELDMLAETGGSRCCQSGFK
jgi:hypothetical protein